MYWTHAEYVYAGWPTPSGYRVSPMGQRVLRQCLDFVSEEEYTNSHPLDFIKSGVCPACCDRLTHSHDSFYGPEGILKTKFKGDMYIAKGYDENDVHVHEATSFDAYVR